MFQRLFSATGTFHVYVIAALIIVLVGLGLSLTVTKSALEAKTAEVQTLTVEKHVLQSDLDKLTHDYELIEHEKQQLIAEGKRISKLNLQNQAEKHRIQSTLNQQNRLIAKLRTSQNETVRAWSVADVPDDALRLLKQAANCANGNQKRNSNCIGSRRDDQPVPNSPRSS
ncbi:hypothetical protein D5018_03905 [Parashewanella curva]|uniref:DUF2570 domain-containing protein n=1 Tax=Parashewanella curva TaxID=2338552 RepID=A0A3L8PZW1_9GAMM|nr:hypothetical protein [Parashewanella curva]RLV60996.1 hypothetical protein D5018_03905 [Parashewanella curva]